MALGVRAHVTSDPDLCSMGVRASSSRSPRYTGGRRFSALGLRDAKQGVWDVTAEFETPPRTPRLGARSPKAREFGLRPRHSGTRDAASESEPWQGGVRDLALGIRALHRGVRETGIMMTERWWETVQRIVSYEGNSDQGSGRYWRGWPAHSPAPQKMGRYVSNYWCIVCTFH